MKKRVAHFIDSDDPGGAETLIIEICNNLQKHDYLPEVYHFGNKWLNDKCIENNIPCIIVPAHKLYKSVVTLPLFMIVFALFLKKREVDILHSHLFDSVIASCIPAFLCRIPHIGTLHDVYAIENNILRMRILSFSIWAGTKLVAVSSQIKNHLANIGRLPVESIYVIKNGVNLDKYLLAKSPTLKSELGISENDIVLICVGRIVKIKAHEILIEAVQMLSDMKLSFKLLIVGDGPEKEKCENLIDKTNHIIKFIGQRDDIPELLNISDCFVLTSRSEGLSCSIIEAMAAGLPVIATDVGGNSELVHNGKNGYLVAVDNPSDISDKIRLIISDYKLRKKFSVNSLSIVKDEFSLDKMVNQYINLYENIS